ncbi:MAG TPA: pyrroloquinoline quinone biosynthesis peptide chaperone PqqD [Polyangiaceae bacterium]|jgi:coenzyme PQQ biosynthesis protein PqqD|nr:pyrroloquinoline quinone biosynthesis peptide chaperone PqqD [Polyangiaceae bacterium]
MITDQACPRLSPKARLRVDKKTGQKVLLYPEKGLLLNPTGARILELCTGERTVASIVELLVGEHSAALPGTIAAEVNGFLQRLFDAGLVKTEPV